MRWIKLIVALICVTLAFGAIAAAPADVTDAVGPQQQSAEVQKAVRLDAKHGTPGFVADLIADVAERHPVILALEVPETEQPALPRPLVG